MKIVLAPDSFKESMTAEQAAAAMERGVRRVLPDADCRRAPMADGGEGTTATLTSALGGTIVPVPVRDALGEPGLGEVGLCPGGVAVLKVASAVGIEAIHPSERNPMAATSLGVADLVKGALRTGARRLIVGLGGSATNDGGAGLLAGMGARLLDGEDRLVPPVPGLLGQVATVDLSGLDPRLAETSIELACDVTNPLLGPHGATAVFGPQKGAGPSQVLALEGALGRFADALERAIGRSVREVPGAGAAGGLGAAFLALGATRRPGVEVVMDAIGFDDLVSDADLVLTGEGSVDDQTLGGKTPAGVAEVAGRYRVPVVAFGGRVPPSADALLDHGFVAVVPILHAVTTYPEALEDGPINLERAVATTLRLLGPRRAAMH